MKVPPNAIYVLSIYRVISLLLNFKIRRTCKSPKCLVFFMNKILPKAKNSESAIYFIEQGACGL